MDGLMGRNNFQNEVIWKRTSAHSSENKFGPIHDVILFYSMGAKYTWNPVFQPYDEDYIKKNYRHRGPLGRYRPSDLLLRQYKRRHQAAYVAFGCRKKELIR